MRYLMLVCLVLGSWTAMCGEANPGYAKIFKWVKDDGTVEYGSEEFETRKEEREYLKQRKKDITAEYEEKLKLKKEEKSDDSEGDKLVRPSYKFETARYKLDKAGILKMNKKLELLKSKLK